MLSVLESQVLRLLRPSLLEGYYIVEVGPRAGFVLQLHSVVGMTGCTDLLEGKILFSRGRGENGVLLLVGRPFLG